MVVEGARDISRYVGARTISEAGSTTIYQARDPDSGREVAIRVFPAVSDEADRRPFDLLGAILGRLAHRSINEVYELGYTDDAEPYIVMAWWPNGSLQDRLEQGPTPWPQAVAYMAEVAEATQAAHDIGVLHRSIRPDTIVLDELGRPKLTGFEIAAVPMSRGATTEPMFSTATFDHIAPEVLQGSQLTAPTDIYAIGSTLHTLIAGRAPFSQREGDSTVSAVITRVLTEPPPDLRIQGVPDPVARVIERSLAKDPNHRYQSAADLGADLKMLLRPGQGPTEDRPDAQVHSVGQPTGRGSPAPDELRPLPQSLPRVTAAPQPTSHVGSGGASPGSSRTAGLDSNKQGGARPGWYHARSDPPGSQRYWDGSRWVGSPQSVGSRQSVTTSGDPVDALLNRHLGPGRVAFNPPSNMKLGERVNFSVRIVRNSALDNSLLEGLDRPSDTLQLSMQTSYRMKVVCTSTDGLAVHPLSEEIQVVASQRFTEWHFSVDAHRHGKEMVWVSASALLGDLNDGISSVISLPVLHQAVDVAVSPLERSAAFARDNWKWVVGTAIGISSAVVAWIGLLS